MRQLIRRRGDAKGGTYINQAGREVEAAAARRKRYPCMSCGRMTAPLPGLRGHPQTAALCDPCAAKMSQAAAVGGVTHDLG